MAPPDMPAALYANAVDAYCTGEPFGAAAQRAGYARPLRMTRDEWRNYICCVLTVREELIKENRPLVQDLVNQVLGAGVWLDAQQANRDKAVAIAAGRNFFNQDPNILRFVMENPTDRVTYGDLRMIRSEFEELMQLSLAAGTIKHPIPYETYVDESFAHECQAGRHRSCEGKTRDACDASRLLVLLLLSARSSHALRRAPSDDATLKAGVFSPPRQAPDFSLSGSNGSELKLQPLSRQGGGAGVSASHPAPMSAR